MKQIIKQIAKILFGDYSIYHIYSLSNEGQYRKLENLTDARFTVLEEEEVMQSKDQLIRDQTMYHGGDACAYGCVIGSEIVGLCYFWYGERYRTRNFWPLAEGEAKLVQIVVIPAMRGRGIASELIAFAAKDMSERGFHRLYARIWHSNTPSLKAFERASWDKVATVAEINPLRWKRPFRIPINRKREGGTRKLTKLF
jgi:RimJ/RimL family protein N-acetyltransferase